MADEHPVDDEMIRKIERPDSNLLIMYTLQAAATLIAFPFVFIPLAFKYHTLRYKFDDEGVSAKWGILFRREIYLTYRRIQDIHVTRNLFERWLGIGKVDIQTASGSARAELQIEGMKDYGAIRDYLYARMRGAAKAPSTGTDDAATDPDDLIALLHGIRDDLDGTRRALETRSGG